MSQAKSFSERIYATPGYREGYSAGCKAAHLRRPDSNPYLPQDLHYLGWIDAFYDAWSVRRLEISRAAEHREDAESKTFGDPVAHSAGRTTNP
jgi:hypothetical protein